jgi:hypothetical protein
VRLCPTCHQPITEGPKLVCGRCLEPIKRGQRWHHIAGRACHDDCDQARSEQEKSAPLLEPEGQA